MTYIFITHDMSVVKHISDNILVMYMGTPFEFAESKELFKNQYHPYTKALLSAVPVPSIKYKKKPDLLKGEISSPINPQPGCRFALRCSHRQDVCLQQNNPLMELSPNHFVSCARACELNTVLM